MARLQRGSKKVQPFEKGTLMYNRQADDRRNCDGNSQTQRSNVRLKTQHW